MTGDANETLFEAPSKGEIRTTGSVMLVTNRYNLLEFLSAGFVLPAPAITKYYADLLELSPGRLPLIRGTVSTSVAGFVSREDPTAFPVALEIDDRAVDDRKLPALDTTGTSGELPLSSPDAVAWAPHGLLPLTAVRRIHFRSAGELEEHAAREYENIRAAEADLVASPDLFADGGIEAETLEAFLTHLPPLQATFAEDLESIDRLHGACCMVLAACAPSADALRAALALSVANELAGSAKERPVRPAPRLGGLPPWLTGSALSGETVATPGAEAGLFRATASVLRRQDRNASWRPLEILGEVEAAVLEERLGKRDAAEVAKNLRPIGAILRNERDFKPFEPGVGLDTAKALLLVLLRPDPFRLTSWERKETGADDAVMVGAAALVGLLRGHKKLTLDLRTAGLDALLANRAAARVAAAWPGALPPPTREEPMIGEHAADGGRTRITVMWEGRLVIERFRRAPSLAELLLAADPSSPEVHGVAVELCRRLDWSDCVATVVAAPEGTFLLDRKANLVQLRVPGVASVTYEVDSGKLRERLTSTALPADLEVEMKERLSGAEV